MLMILGVIVGGILGGALTDSFHGAILGGFLGAFAVHAWKGKGRAPTATLEPDRIALLERKAQYLYEQLQGALARIERLEAGTQSATPAQGQAPASEASPAVTSAPVTEAQPATPFEADALYPSSVNESAASVAKVAEEQEGSPPSALPGVVTAAQEATADVADQRPAVTAPTAFDRALAGVRAWFMGGNTVVRVGIVILFFGVAFLLKYAYEHAQVAPELRIAGVALGSLILLMLGWRLRERQSGYALALQGGGVGLLYLTIFAAFRLYDLLPPTAAFGLLICVAVLSAALALLQNSQALAILGASGGFLAPVLASTGQGSHIMLFGYYFLLNLGILAIAWFKAWRPLNLTGFVFTFGIGLAWGGRFYRPEFFQSCELFLLLFYLLYLAVSLLFATRQAPRLKHYLDGTLIFGLPIVAFGTQVRLMADLPYGAAISALILGAVYVLLARWLYARHRDTLRDLVEAFLALGLVFGTLAIPLALDGRWTSATWALEGAAVLWVGIRQQRLLARLFGLTLQILAAAAFMQHGHGTIAGELPLANSFFLGALFLAVAGLFSNWIIDRHRDTLHRVEPWLGHAAFVWGTLWWVTAGFGEIDRQVPEAQRWAAALIFVAASCAAFGALHLKVSWAAARFPVLALIPFAGCALLAQSGHPAVHPLRGLGWIAWPAWLVSHLWLVKRFESSFVRAAPWLHGAGVWILAVVGAWELAYRLDSWVSASQVWGLIGWMVMPTILLLALVTRGKRLAWPVQANWMAYLINGALPVLGFLGVWAMYSNGSSDGDPSPLPYVPVLNPLDIAQLGTLLLAPMWLRQAQDGQFIRRAEHVRWFYIALGVVAFICANGMLLRALHHFSGVPFDWDRMMASMLVQAAFSIFWTVLALVAMVVATRLARRALWITGAGLMGVVVVKLFLLDLSNIAGVERIVAFIGVGVLMLVVGYFSPVPPKRQQAPQ